MSIDSQDDEPEVFQFIQERPKLAIQILERIRSNPELHVKNESIRSHHPEDKLRKVIMKAILDDTIFDAIPPGNEFDRQASQDQLLQTDIQNFRDNSLRFSEEEKERSRIKIGAGYLLILANITIAQTYQEEDKLQA